MTVLDTGGTVVARSVGPDRYIGTNVFASTDGRPAWPDSTHVGQLPGFDGIMRLTASVKSRRAPWIVNVGVSVDAFEAPLQEQLRENIALSLVALLIALAGAYLIGGASRAR